MNGIEGGLIRNLDANPPPSKIRKIDSQIAELAAESLGAAPAEGRSLSQGWLFPDSSPTLFLPEEEGVKSQLDYNTPPFITVFSGSQFDSQDLEKEHAVIHDACRCSTVMKQVFGLGSVFFMPTVNKGLYNAHKSFCLSILRNLQKSEFLKERLDSIALKHANESPAFLLAQLNEDLKKCLQDEEYNAVESMGLTPERFYSMGAIVQEAEDRAICILRDMILEFEEEPKMDAAQSREWMYAHREELKNQKISLQFNLMGLRCIPPEIAFLENLVGLSLSFNDIRALPEEISQLTQLTSLRLDDNPIAENQEEISRLKNALKGCTISTESF